MKLFKAILSVWASRKLWMTLIANGLLWAAYERAINHLYAIPDTKVAGFVAITHTVLYGISAVSLGYVGVQGVVQMRQNVMSAVSQTVSEIVERTPRPRDFEQDDSQV